MIERGGKVPDPVEKEEEIIETWCFKCHKTRRHEVMTGYNKKTNRHYEHQICCICGSASHLI